MKISLVWKLTIAFMAVVLCSTLVVAVFIRLTSSENLIEFILEQQRSDLLVTLNEYYATHGSWDTIAEDWPRVMTQARRPTSTATNEENWVNQKDYNEGPPPDRKKLFGLADPNGIVLVSIDRDYPEGSMASQASLAYGVNVVVDGKVVGTILMEHIRPFLTPEESMFLDRMNMAVIYGAIFAGFVALIMGIVLATTLVKPIRALTMAAQNISEGKLEQEVIVPSRDEIGQLADSFNQMSREVARVNKLRRQMTADIAHDLRTPLTVIAGYVESMQDGILQPTPERLAIIGDEIGRLQNLVGDLRTLSLADSGELPIHPQLLSPRTFLERAAAPYEHRVQQQNISLVVDTADDLPQIWLDESRILQVLGNLINNSLRHTPEGGKITLSAKTSGRKLEISVADTGSGISKDDIPHIFERFFRSDPSRFSESGETSGLGLAIAKAFVELQGGKILVESELGKGTVMRMTFPLNYRPKTVD